MTDRASHLTLDVLADYFAETLGDEQEERIELHIADCQRCAATARWVHNLPRPNLETWTAQSHGEVTLRAYLAERLAQTEAVQAEESTRERLLRWREQLTGEADKALHLIKEASGHISQGLNVLLPPAGGLEGAGLGGTWPRPASAAAFNAGDPEIRTGSEPEAGPTVHIAEKGIGIEVRVEGAGDADTPRMVALIPTREGGEPKVRMLEEVPDQPGTWRARFVKDDEEFVIALEPE